MVYRWLFVGIEPLTFTGSLTTMPLTWNSQLFISEQYMTLWFSALGDYTEKLCNTNNLPLDASKTLIQD